MAERPEKSVVGCRWKVGQDGAGSVETAPGEQVNTAVANCLDHFIFDAL